MDSTKETPNYVKCLDCGYDGFDKENGTFYCARCGNVAEDIAEREMDYTQFDHIEDWTVADIIDWHRICFEKATLESQEDRVQEEMDEYEANKEVSELADCIISCCGISRFNFYYFISKQYIIMRFIENETPYTFEQVSQAINDKMKINLQRWKDGEWVWDEQTQQYKRGK